MIGNIRQYDPPGLGAVRLWAHCRTRSSNASVYVIVYRSAVHRIHTRSVHHEHYSLLTSTNMKCVLVAQDVMSRSIFVRMKIVGHLVTHVTPCWSLLHLLSPNPPQHEGPLGQHDLLQDDTVHRAPLPKPIRVDKQRL